jgi:hypothetical protein
MDEGISRRTTWREGDSYMIGEAISLQNLVKGQIKIQFGASLTTEALYCIYRARRSSE